MGSTGTDTNISTFSLYFRGRGWARDPVKTEMMELCHSSLPLLVERFCVTWLRQWWLPTNSPSSLCPYTTTAYHSCKQPLARLGCFPPCPLWSCTSVPQRSHAAPLSIDRNMSHQVCCCTLPAAKQLVEGPFLWAICQPSAKYIKPRLRHKNRQRERWAYTVRRKR